MGRQVSRVRGSAMPGFMTWWRSSGLSERPKQKRHDRCAATILRDKRRPSLHLKGCSHRGLETEVCSEFPPAFPAIFLKILPFIPRCAMNGSEQFCETKFMKNLAALIMLGSLVLAGGINAGVWGVYEGKEGPGK